MKQRHSATASLRPSRQAPLRDCNGLVFNAGPGDIQDFGKVKRFYAELRWAAQQSPLQSPSRTGRRPQWCREPACRMANREDFVYRCPQRELSSGAAHVPVQHSDPTAMQFQRYLPKDERTRVDGALRGQILA